MANKPKVSIIIPVYNGEKTIRETLESVLQQSLTALEVIVINDGSTDGTVAVLDAFCDARLRVYTFANAGVAISRNRGIDLAQGDYVAFLDADDLWTPDKLASHIAALEANPQAAVAYSWTDCIDAEGQFLRSGSYVSQAGWVFQDLLQFDFLDSGSNAVICRRALEQIDGFDPTLSPAEDWDFLLKLAEKFDFVSIPKVQVKYRIHAATASQNIARMEQAMLKVLWQNFSKLGGDKNARLIQKTSLAHAYSYFLLKALDNASLPNRALLAMKYYGLFIWHDIKPIRPIWHKLSLLVKVFLIRINPQIKLTIKY
jgi:glycosyltransferase involved in cell wall biosynthesis